jgi:hypothetical protein
MMKMPLKRQKRCIWIAVFLPVEDFGDISLTTQPVDGMLLEQAKKEIKKVCQNARSLNQRPSNRSVTLSDVSNYFLKDIMPGLCFSLCENDA